MVRTVRLLLFTCVSVFCHSVSSCLLATSQLTLQEKGQEQSVSLSAGDCGAAVVVGEMDFAKSKLKKKKKKKNKTARTTAMIQF